MKFHRYLQAIAVALRPFNLARAATPMLSYVIGPPIS
jgi:hypothetical protein